MGEVPYTVYNWGVKALRKGLEDEKFRPQAIVSARDSFGAYMMHTRDTNRPGNRPEAQSFSVASVVKPAPQGLN